MISKKVSGIIEIKYTQKGGNFEYNNPFRIQSSEKLKLNYFEIPIMIGFNNRSNFPKVFPSLSRPPLGLNYIPFKNYVLNKGFGDSGMFLCRKKYCH